ncbi:PREDICTED: uncharacterized protein LOC101302660 [Fragaria vesca subsp. vesca]
MEGVRSVITEEINQDLMAPVLEEEVRAAVFQLGALVRMDFQVYSIIRIISVNQNVFVPGRLIQDNILLAHETYHYLKLKQEGGKHELALKLNMIKAYNRVEQDFFEVALIRFGFSRDWIRLIMACVTTVSFAIVLNGKPGRTFYPSRGLRQGYPISPYLFLLVSEVLSLRLTKCVRDGSLIGIRLSRGGPIMSHLFFADDALFFIWATLGNASRLSLIFKDYYTASGQAISQDKSSIFFSPNSPEQMVFLLCELLGFDCVDDPGKETLIKSVAMAIPAYTMACFKFPKNVCESFDSLFGNFWWGMTPRGNKIHWRSWDFLSQPKADGGLGFRNLQHFNMALLAKQVWKLVENPTSLWAEVLKSRYFPDCNFFSALKGYRASWSWSSLLEARDIILAGCCWQVVNGSSVRVWQDKWLPNPSPRLLPSSTVSRLTAHVLVNQLIDWERKVWNLSDILGSIGREVAEQIQEMPIGEIDGQDRLIWPHDKSRNYTVRSGYIWIHHHEVSTSKPITASSSSYQINKVIWPLLWKIKTIPKVSFGA